MMRDSLFLLSLLGVLMLSSVSFSLPAPPYLSVPHWKNCVDTLQKGSAQFVCLPDKKPAKCPNRSWKKLMADKMMEACQ